MKEFCPSGRDLSRLPGGTPSVKLSFFGPVVCEEKIQVSYF